jgi:hypothetical protein
MTKKKVVLTIGGLCLAVLAGCGTYGYQQDRGTYGYQQERSGGESWNVGQPREMVMVPGSQVYFVPNLSFDLFFYNNYWWSQRGNKWYRSSNYNGPRESIEQRYVPTPVFQVPNDYRSRYEKQQRIPYGQWNKQGKDNKKEDKQVPGQDKKNKPDQR